MKVCLTKMQWPTRSLIAAALVLQSTAWAGPTKPQSRGYRFSIRSQLGSFLDKPFEDLASNRFLLDLSQRFKSKNEYLTSVLSARLRVQHGRRVDRPLLPAVADRGLEVVRAAHAQVVAGVARDKTRAR